VAKISISIPFSIGQDEALRRVKTLLPEIKAEHEKDLTDFAEEWDGNGCKFSFRGRGVKISGAIFVSAFSVDLAATVPFPASMFAGKIDAAIRERATKLLT
jgi:hypothetical protein